MPMNFHSFFYGLECDTQKVLLRYCAKKGNDTGRCTHTRQTLMKKLNILLDNFNFKFANALQKKFEKKNNVLNCFIRTTIK